MHHTFYVNNLTTCGRVIDPSIKNGTRYSKSNTLGATGLDSLVTCANCLIELAKYREHFPLASNKIERVLMGDRLVDFPVMEGGAR